MAVSSTHFYYELTQKLQDVVTQRFRDLPFENGTIVPTTTDLDPGVREVAEDVMTGVGEATLLAPGASDIPLVQVNVTEDRYPVVMAVSAYSLEFQEQRSLEYSRKPVREERLRFARRAIAERINRFAAYGDTAIATRGFLNNANISVDNNSFATNATFDVWVAFLMDVILRVGLDSDQVTQTTDVLMSPRMYAAAQKVTATTGGTNVEKSALQAVRERLIGNDGVPSVNFWPVPECASARLEKYGVQSAATNRDRIVVYNREPMTCARQIEAAIAQLMPEEYVQTKGTTRYYPLFSCASATKIRDLALLP